MILAHFLQFEGDKAIIKCRIDENNYEIREFDKILVEGIKNPKLLFIGIMHGPGFMQITFRNANRYWKLFKKQNFYKK